MRRAGLVACANRNNRQPMPGVGTHREVERRDHHTRADVSGPCVGHAHKASLPHQHQGRLIGTNNNGQGRSCRSAVKQRMVWGNDKVQWSGAGGKENRKGRCDDGQRTTWQRGVGAIRPRCCSKAVSGVHRADRGPLASRHRQRPGTSSSGGWIEATGFRSKRAVVPEIEHVGDDAAGSSVASQRYAYWSDVSIVDEGWSASCCNSSSTWSARIGVITVISMSCSRRTIVCIA